VLYRPGLGITLGFVFVLKIEWRFLNMNVDVEYAKKNNSKREIVVVFAIILHIYKSLCPITSLYIVIIGIIDFRN
jgi:hypothetical protein